MVCIYHKYTKRTTSEGLKVVKKRGGGATFFLARKRCKKTENKPTWRQRLWKRWELQHTRLLMDAHKSFNLQNKKKPRERQRKGLWESKVVWEGVGVCIWVGRCNGGGKNRNWITECKSTFFQWGGTDRGRDRERKRGKKRGRDWHLDVNKDRRVEWMEKKSCTLEDSSKAPSICMRAVP